MAHDHNNCVYSFSFLLVRLEETTFLLFFITLSQNEWLKWCDGDGEKEEVVVIIVGDSGF